jgi:hypothetical protein
MNDFDTSTSHFFSCQREVEQGNPFSSSGLLLGISPNFSDAKMSIRTEIWFHVVSVIWFD